MVTGVPGERGLAMKLKVPDILGHCVVGNNR